MPRYFIDHPVFAWVIAILIVIAGGLAIRQLGVESYPDIAPAQVGSMPSYPGASAETTERAVTPDHRAAAQRHRQPRLFQLLVQLQWWRLDQPDLQARHRSRHRADAGAEQGLAGDAAAADRRGAAGRDRVQGQRRLPAGGGVEVEQIRRSARTRCPTCWRRACSTRSPACPASAAPSCSAANMR